MKNIYFSQYTFLTVYNKQYTTVNYESLTFKLLQSQIMIIL